MCNYRADLTRRLNCCVKHQFEVKSTLFIIVGSPNANLTSYALLAVESLAACYNTKAEAALKLRYALIDKHLATLKNNHTVDKILDIDHCWLQPDPSNPLRDEIKRYCIENGYSFHNAKAHEGLMRTMVVRTASTGEIMVIVVFNEADMERINALMSHLQTSFPEITSLIYMVNDKWNDSLGDREPICFAGKDHIIEQMEGLQFKVGPKSFYQTNSEQAYELYKVTREFADLKAEDTLYDLYTGTGTIANFCARHAHKVVGVEYVPEAIEDAKVNSAINNIANTTFYAGDMKDVLSDDFVARNGRPDVIILDPPRAGVDERVIDVIKRAAPERMVYVSCNPSTQARDLALMSDMYEVVAVQPVDMFPHTHHVENVVKLKRK